MRNIRHVIFGTVLMCMSAACNAQISVTNRSDNSDQHNHAEADTYARECEAGTAFRCTNLGEMYETGKGVPQDKVHAFELFRKGCDGGHARGCANLGLMYRNGWGVALDSKLALSAFQAALKLETAEHLKQNLLRWIAQLEQELAAEK
jgi:TPR repeat protein